MALKEMSMDSSPHGRPGDLEVFTALLANDALFSMPSQLPPELAGDGDRVS
jgi:hypothetical protein